MQLGASGEWTLWGECFPYFFDSNAYVWSNQLVLEVYFIERKISHLQLIIWLIMLLYQAFMSKKYSVVLMLMNLYMLSMLVDWSHWVVWVVWFWTGFAILEKGVSSVASSSSSGSQACLFNIGFLFRIYTAWIISFYYSKLARKDFNG